MYSMPLKELLSVISIDNQLNFANEELLISELSIDSRKVSNGTLFIAYPGTTADGRNYLVEAQAAGATAVLFDSDDYKLPDTITIPAYAVKDLQLKVGILANQFYQHPSAEMQVFGVTGTNGKTTCCYLMTQALTALGMQSVMIGTIGVGPLDELSTSGHTTPDAISVHRLLATWRDAGITQVCMEVSSHALDQGRVSGVQFFCTLFTNLSHDHLDYHGDMAAYRAAKQRLFTDYSSELVIANADDEMGASLIDIAHSDFIASYGLKNGDVSCDDLSLNRNGMSFTVEANQIDFDVNTKLIGLVNIPNVLMLVTTLLSLSIAVEDIQKVVANLEAAPGRMELYTSNGKPSVVVDYAHTPDALEKALMSVDSHCEGNIWCVFGCGGDRDKTKRPLMGAVAHRLSSYVIVTNDNPRSESAESIASDVIAGIESSESSQLVKVILDRSEAISYAISEASSDDWILVAGKGHETTQQIGDKFHEFSDRDHVSQYLGLAA